MLPKSGESSHTSRDGKKLILSRTKVEEPDYPPPPPFVSLNPATLSTHLPALLHAFYASRMDSGLSITEDDPFDLAHSQIGSLGQIIVKSHSSLAAKKKKEVNGEEKEKRKSNMKKMPYVSYSSVHHSSACLTTLGNLGSGRAIGVSEASLRAISTDYTQCDRQRRNESDVRRKRRQHRSSEGRTAVEIRQYQTKRSERMRMRKGRRNEVYEEWKGGQDHVVPVPLSTKHHICHSETS